MSGTTRRIVIGLPSRCWLRYSSRSWAGFQRVLVTVVLSFLGYAVSWFYRAGSGRTVRGPLQVDELPWIGLVEHGGDEHALRSGLAGRGCVHQQGQHGRGLPGALDRRFPQHLVVPVELM